MQPEQESKVKYHQKENQHICLRTDGNTKVYLISFFLFFKRLLYALFFFLKLEGQYLSLEGLYWDQYDLVSSLMTQTVKPSAPSAGLWVAPS